MKYFVTGGSGFIGGELVKQLTAEGHECVVLIRNPNKAKDELKNKPKVTLHKGDIVDKESMRSAMEGCDGVFHLAAWFKVSNCKLRLYLQFCLRLVQRQASKYCPSFT